MIDPKWNHDEWIGYFRNDLAPSVSNDVRPLLARTGSFGIPRQFFPYVEYLAGLVYGPASPSELSNSTRAVQFMDELLPKRSPYGPQAWLLIHMWRDGTIHRCQPKTLLNGKGDWHLGWYSYYGSRGNESVTLPNGVKTTISHLVVWPNPKDSFDYLPVCMGCLVDDLDETIESVARLLEVEKAASGSELLSRMRDAAGFMRKPVENKRYPFAW